MLPHLGEERQKKVWRKTAKQAKNGPLSRYSTYYNQQVNEKKRAKNGPLLRFQLRGAKEAHFATGGGFAEFHPNLMVPDNGGRSQISGR